jgi:predicted nucleic acid-binding protein
LCHSEAPPGVRAWAQHPPAWLEVATLQRLDGTLSPESGAGKREAICLAVEMKADVLLIDDRAGREQAEVSRIKILGTLAVLSRSSLRRGLTVDDFGERLASPLRHAIEPRQGSLNT